MRELARSIAARSNKQIAKSPTGNKRTSEQTSARENEARHEFVSLYANEASQPLLRAPWRRLSDAVDKDEDEDEDEDCRSRRLTWRAR